MISKIWYKSDRILKDQNRINHNASMKYQHWYSLFCFSPWKWILLWVHGRIGQMEQRILLSCIRWEPRCILLWDWKPQILLHQERPSHSIGGSRVSIKIYSKLENIQTANVLLIIYHSKWNVIHFSFF